MTEHTAAPFPGIEKVEFLQDDYIRHYSQLAGVEEQDITQILLLRDSLLQKPSFIRLLWEFHDLLYEQGLPFPEVLPENPKLGSLLGDALRGVFYYLLVLSAFPFSLKNYEKRGWPESVWNTVFCDTAVWLAHHKRNFGTPGLTWRIFNWLQGHLNCQLVGFGRLQFNTQAFFRGKELIFRNISSKEVTAITNCEIDVRADGIPDDLHETVSADSFRTTFAETEDSWTGNLITPDGRIQKQIVTILKSQWTLELQPGDPVLETHIPEGGSMTYELCCDSMNKAMEFFAQYLPDYHWKAFHCDSWLLDPQLQSILPETSNILAFQRAGYVLPAKGRADTVFRVFGIKADLHGIGTVPLRTSLQNSLAVFLKNGGEFHMAERVILRKECEVFSPNPYQQTF